MNRDTREYCPSRSEAGSWIDTGDTPLLSHEEELALGARVAQGDAEARDHLVRANLRLVVSIAKRYRGCGVPFGDLVGEGNLGLIKAAETFDATTGLRFCTHAKHWIRQCILMAIENQTRPIRLPHNATQAVVRWCRKEEELAETLGRPPTRDETANALGMPRSKLSTMQAALIAARSVGTLDGRDGDDGWCSTDVADPRGDATLAVDGELDEDAEALPRMLARLDEREREIIELRFGLNGGKQMTLTMIGERLGCTGQRVRQMEAKSLRKMAV